MPARQTLMPSPWSEESCSSSGRATCGGSGTASWRVATRHWRPVTGEGFPATSMPHLKTRQETFGSFRVSRRLWAGVVQVGDSRDVWYTVGQVQTGVMDNEITVVKLLECCLTHCSVYWAGVHKHQLFSPERLKFLISLSGSCSWWQCSFWCLWSAFIQPYAFKEAGRGKPDAAGLHQLSSTL